MFKFELGQKAKNKTTGVEGKITGRVDYLEGPNRYFVEDGNNRWVYGANDQEEWSEEENVEVISE